MRPANAVSCRRLDLEGGARLTPCNYDVIRADSARLHGTDIGRFRPTLLSALYGDCLHLNVEDLGGPFLAGIFRVQDPPGGSRTSTFDHGWLSVAESETQELSRED